MMGLVLTAWGVTASVTHSARIARIVRTGADLHTARLTAGKTESLLSVALVAEQVEGFALVLPVSEAIFLAQVEALADIHGWSTHHSRPAQTSKGRWMTNGSVGFPDLVLSHKTKGLLFAELKSDKGKATKAQLAWLERLSPFCEAYLWRPDDINDIAQRLSA